jgi:PEP-CTERM/exosortase A-associated glycosyltransferase
MKILHILDHSLPLHSGYTFRSQNIFREQKKRGWEPVIVTSPKHEESWKKPTMPVEEINGFKYYRTGPVGNSGPPILSELKLMKALSKRIHEVAEIEKPDLLHAHSPVLNAIPALRVGKRLGIPVVYEIRAFWEDAAVDHGTTYENSLRYRATRRLETWVCHRAAHVNVLCEGLKKDLAQRGIPSDKMTIIYNGINTDAFRPTPPDEEFLKKWDLQGKKVIGFIGSFYRYEGLDLLIEAFAGLSTKHPDLVLLLVGGGEMESALHDLDCFDTLSNRIIMPGRIPHDRIPGVYALIDILVYPRYSMRLTELVTPLKPLEAMAMGKVVVASDVGGHRELIEHHVDGVLFPAGDKLALAKAIERLLETPDFSHQIAARALSRVSDRFPWHQTTAPYEIAYQARTL